MKWFRKPLFTGFAPHITVRDTFIALSFLFLPWKWRKLRQGDAPKKIETWLENYFGNAKAYTFDSGRSALFCALEACGVGEGDEVLVQAYTCLVVINAIRWTGAWPVFVDILDDYTMDPDDARKKITEKTKVLIIQHTFGTPAQLDALVQLGKEHGLKIVEDCAHSLGAHHNGKLTGTFGDIGIFSFGSDKVVSCVRGGGVVVNDDALAQKIQAHQSTLPLFPLGILLQHLMHYPVFLKGRWLYNLGVGKLVLWVANRIRIINRIIYPQEKKGEQIAGFPAQLPNALATILLEQLNELDTLNQRRQTIARIYQERIDNPNIEKPAWSDESIYVRYPVCVSDPKNLRDVAKREGIILGDWYDTVVAPKDSDRGATRYMQGTCPHAEKLAACSVNLPTERHITERDAERIARICTQYGR